MSNNPQWKSFQPPTMNTDSSILDFAKSLTIHNNTPSPLSNYRNPSNGSSFNSSNNYHPASLMGPNLKNDSNKFPRNTSGCNYTNFNSYTSNNSSMFPPIGTFSPDTTDMFNGETAPVSNAYSTSNNTNSTYNDSSQNNQGTRETGIIEKLLVII